MAKKSTPKPDPTPEAVNPDTEQETALVEAEAADTEVVETAAEEAEDLTPEAQGEADTDADPLDDVHMTLEQFIGHLGLPPARWAFAVGVLIRGAGAYPRLLREWKTAYATHLGDL